MDGQTVGRIVIYRTEDGGQSYAAMIAGTGDVGVTPEIPLSSASHVHLFVFDARFEHPVHQRDVPFDEDFGPIAGEFASQAPGTWRWPVR